MCNKGKKTIHSLLVIKWAATNIYICLRHYGILEKGKGKGKGYTISLNVVRLMIWLNHKVYDLT